MPKKFLRASANIYVLIILVGAMAAAAFMAGGFPTNYDQIITATPTPFPTGTSVEPDVEQLLTPPLESRTRSSSGSPETHATGAADLVVVSFKLTDEQGKEKTVFDPGEKIYPKVTHNNIGTKRVESASGYILSQIYDNQPAPAVTGQLSDVNVWMRNGRYSPNYIKTYAAYPGGLHSGFFKGSRYWVRYRPGTFTARSFINYDHGGIEDNYDNNQTTITYTIRNKPSPTPTKKPTPTPKNKPASVGNASSSPNSATCGGKYRLNNPMGKNFGDPSCNANKDAIYNSLKAADSENASYWFYTVIPCEAPGYNPNEYYRCGGAGCTPDPAGAWGLFQMGRGRNGQYDHGDVNWPKQITNATTYRRNLGWYGWRYWACASSRW